jgi:hypothetical protein
LCLGDLHRCRKRKEPRFLEQSQLAPPQDVFSASTTTHCAPHATSQTTTGLTGALVSWGPPSLQEKERTSLLGTVSACATGCLLCLNDHTMCTSCDTANNYWLDGSTCVLGTSIAAGKGKNLVLLEQSQLAPRQDVFCASTTTHYAPHATSQTTTGVTGALVSWGPPSLQEKERTSLLEQSQLAPRQDVLSASTTTHCALHATSQSRLLA